MGVLAATYDTLMATTPNPNQMPRVSNVCEMELDLPNLDKRTFYSNLYGKFIVFVCENKFS